MITEKTQSTFSSLREIRAYKENISKELQKDEENIAKLWNELFHNTDQNLPAKPVQHLSKVINISSGIIDGLLLGWKLYRKFKGTTSIFKRKKYR